MAAAGGPETIVRVGPLIAPDGVGVEIDDGPATTTVRLVARIGLVGIATGRFSQPSSAVPIHLEGEPTYLGFSFTQFAMPVIAGRRLDFDFHPAPNLHSPPVLGVLIARTAGTFVLLAPLDHPHEQVIAVADGGLLWGWHGDLEEVPAGFSTTLGVFSGPTLDPLLNRWGDAVRAGRPRRPVTDSPLTSHLSYWSDNGAAYWYRTEPGRTNGGSVADAVQSFARGGHPDRRRRARLLVLRPRDRPTDRRDRLPRGRAAHGDADVDAAT